RDRPDPRGQSFVSLDPSPLPSERQPSARRVHHAVRFAALVQRLDPGGSRSRSRRPRRANSGLHGRGGREAVAADLGVTTVSGFTECAKGSAGKARPATSSRKSLRLASGVRSAFLLNELALWKPEATACWSAFIARSAISWRSARSAGEISVFP